MGKKNTERYIRPSNRKHREDDLHQSNVTMVRKAERIPEEGNVKKVFKNIPEGRRSAEKSRKRWLKMSRRKWVLEAGEK